MSGAPRATMNKRQRELNQKERARAREERRAARRARTAERAARGEVGPPMGEPPAPLGEYDVEAALQAGARGQTAAEPEPARTTGNRLYVGNLSYDTTIDTLRELFTEFGPVTDVHIAMDRETGLPRGFAFVTMGASTAADTAIREVDGRILDGRPLRVNQAEDRSRGPGRGPRGPGRRF